MGKLYHKIRIGQNFHHEGRMGKNGVLNTNGVITEIDYDNDEITVSYERGEREEYSFDCLWGNWSEKFNGYWHYVG